MTTTQIAKDANGDVRDRTDMDLGISYGTGPMSFALQYGSAELDDAAGLTDTLDIYQVHATYVVGPGFSVGTVVSKGEFDDATVIGGLDNDFTSVALTTALSF